MSAARRTETPAAAPTLAARLAALSEAATQDHYEVVKAGILTDLMAGPVLIAETAPVADATYIAALVNAHRDGLLVTREAVLAEVLAVLDDPETVRGTAQSFYDLLQRDDLCHICWLPIATDEQWETVPEGERPDLCWDEPLCSAAGDDADTRLAGLASITALAAVAARITEQAGGA